MKYYNFICVFVGYLCISICGQAQTTAQSYSVKDTTVANSYMAIAEKFAEEAQYDSSNVYFEKASKIFEKTAQHLEQTRLWEQYVRCCINIGTNLRKKNEYNQAMTFLNKALEAGKRELGEKHIDVSRCYHIIGYVYTNKGEYDQALININKSLAIRLDISGNNHPEVAKIYNNLGYVYWKNGNYDKALEYYDNSLAIKLKLFGERHTSVAASYTNIGIIYERKDEYDQALMYYNKSLDISLETMGQKHPNIAKIYNNLGIIHKKRDEYDQSLEYHHKSLSIKLEVLGERHPSVAASYTNIGIVFREKGNYDRALEYYNKAIDIDLEAFGENHPYVATDYQTIGIVHEDKRDYDLALQYYQKSLGIRLEVLGSEHPNVASSYNWIGNVYFEKGNYDLALEYYQKSLMIKIEVYGEKHRSVAYNYNNIGNAYFEKGDYNQALENYHKSHSITLELLGERHSEVAESYLNTGKVYARVNDFNKALEYFQKSLEILLEVFGEKHPYVAQCYQNIAELYKKQNSLNKSLSYYQKSVISLIHDFNNINIYVNPILKNISSENLLLMSLEGKSDVLGKLYKYNSKDISAIQLTLSTYELACELIDQIRNSYKAEQSKLRFGEETLNIYSNGIQTSLQMFQLTQEDQYQQKAFLFAEKSKSAVLSQTIQESQARRFTGISDSLLEKERDIRINLTFYETEIQKEKFKKEKQDSIKLQDYEGRFFVLNREYEMLIDHLEQTYPNYYDLKYRTETVSVTDIQKSIDNNTAILEYFLGDSSIYIFVITKDQFDVKTINRDSILTNSINSLVNSLKSVSGKTAYLENAALLYQSLITPVESQIADKQKWIVIPDGELYKVPFEALLSNPVSSPEEAEYKDIDYLVKEHELSYHYSSTLYLRNRSADQTYEKDFVGFAPVFSKDNATLASTENSLFSLESIKAMWDLVTRDGKNLDELKYSETEVIQIRSMFATGKSRVFVHQDASEENFKKNLRNTKYVHVATHGFMQSENPKLSNLTFSQPDSADNDNEDGILYSGETYNLDLDSDLLVLSACQTGTGKLAGGEGVMALTRGFLYSGANNIIASLWRVFDEHTSLMMVELYRQILKGKSYSVALRDAKLEMISNKTTASPQSWASFVLIGR
jgi:CHAT domain-containing protein/Tfp pilus assembly protein PilF